MTDDNPQSQKPFSEVSPELMNRISRHRGSCFAPTDPADVILTAYKNQRRPRAIKENEPE